FNAKFTVGASRWDYFNYGINGRSGTWYYPNMYTFFNLTDPTQTADGETVVVDKPSTLTARETYIRERINSVYSFINLSYDNYLFLELTGRNDWASSLPPESNSYFYPSASLSFIATEAFGIQDKLHWLNFLKVRGGAAQSATDADPYTRNFYYTTGFFAGQQTSYLPGNIPPFALKPQRTNSYEAGLNMGFFENRIDFDFTYYYLYSFDQYLPGLPLPSSAGATGITTNEGIVTNNGIELTINAVPVRTKNVLFRTGINFARNRNYVESLGGDADVIEIANIWGLNGPSMVLREGDQYGTIYGYDYVYHENGQPIVNEQGTHYLYTDTRKPIGNASPDFLAGWTTELSFKGFTLSTLIDTKWGGQVYSGSYVINLQTGQSPETLVERDGGGLAYTDPEGNTSNVGVILDGVYEDGTPNDKVVHYYYKYLPNAGGWGKFLSTPGVVENSWVKMREIGISYQVPTKAIKWLKFFQNLSLSVVGRDLFYIYSSLPDNINPEGIMGSGNAQGFEWASMPASRAVTFGISASF
ncbi:MAG: TonB-dependent receptor, partial [Bacteroidales bacterium]|nr:TonB-dependent receptor [Bacteroidales bacterium]